MNISTTFQSLGLGARVVSLITAAAIAAPFGLAAAGTATASNGFCVYEGGSTTVEPAITQAKAGFQGANPGCSLRVGTEGSGGGIAGVIGGNDGAITYTAGSFDVGASSRAPKTTGGVNGAGGHAGAGGSVTGNEKDLGYFWKVGGDAMTMMVSSGAAMDFLVNTSSGHPEITPSQISQIYNGTLTFWDGDPTWAARGAPHTAIAPRCRIVGSGSRSDFLSFFNVTAETCASTRLQTSLDDAQAATQDFAIVYSSLANVGYPGTRALWLSGGSGFTKIGGTPGVFVDPTRNNVQNGTYPAPRVLYLTIQKFSNPGVDAINDPNVTKAIAFVNYMASSSGQAAVNTVGFVQVTPFVPVPAYDVNLDGVVTLPDLGQVTSKWGQTNSLTGWTRADVNNDGAITLPDIGSITARWGATGFVAPN
jgi:ABC-type phosphate transport system substrate-binding protein